MKLQNMNQFSKITLLLTLFVGQGFAQNYGKEQLQNYLLKEQSRIKTIETAYENMEGSPFLNKVFTEGDVFTDFGSFKSVKMKYNIMEDAFLFDLNNHLQYLDPLASISKIKYNDQVFKVKTFMYKSKLKNGFVVQLDSGKVSLFAKKNIVFRPAEPPKALESAPHLAQFLVNNDTYFLQNDNADLVAFDGLKTLYEMFPAIAESLKAYVKKEKLSSKKETDLIAIVQFCNKYL